MSKAQDNRIRIIRIMSAFIMGLTSRDGTHLVAEIRK